MSPLIFIVPGLDVSGYRVYEKTRGEMVSVGEHEVCCCEVCRDTSGRSTEVVLTCPPSLPFDNMVDTNERLLRETTELSSSHV